MPPTSPSLLLHAVVALAIISIAYRPVSALSQQSASLSSPDSVDNSMEATDLQQHQQQDQEQQEQPPSPPTAAASIASNSPVAIAAAAASASASAVDTSPAARPVLALSAAVLASSNAQQSQAAASQSQLHLQPQSGSTGGFPGEYHPRGPLVKCAFLPEAFLDCNEPIDHRGNRTSRDELGHGCVRFGGSRYEDVERTRVICNVLPDIECHGDRSFLRGGYPCVRYTDHYFVTTLLYSILLGFLGMDRFCLGQTGTAVGKLLTMGGLGIWWLVDIVLLITNNLLPEDGSNWNVRV